MKTACDQAHTPTRSASLRSVAVLMAALLALVTLALAGSNLALAAHVAPGSALIPGAAGQMTPTPSGQPGTGSKDGVAPPTGGGPITDLTPGDGSAGLVTATITLEGPSGAEVFARFSPGGDARTSSRAALAAAWQAVLNAINQQKLVAALTAPDIGATVIGQSQLAANSITVQVDAAKVPAIRALPGVRSVTINVPAVIDPILPPQDQLDPVQPPGDQLD